jgi:hypothetical protein
VRYFESAYVLSLPVAVWFLYRFSPFNNNDGLLDPWVYFGYIHNFQDLISRYGLRYYSVRFGLIFPHIVLAKIFGPVTGYLAFVYSMYLLAGIPLYLLFRKLYSAHAAVLAYAILVSSAWFARTVLWTHPDAAAVPYLIAALALMFLEPRYRRVVNFAIGVLIALAVNSNVFAISIAGLIGVAYLSYFRDSLWSRFRQDIPWMIAGFVSVFVAGSAGYYACCGHVNYFTSTLDMVKWSNNGGGAVYQAPVTDLLRMNYIYLPPFIAISTYVVSKHNQFKANRLLSACTHYLIAVMTVVLLYRFATQSAIIELFYYFSFFLVSCIGCIALIPLTLARASNCEARSVNYGLAAFLLPPLLIVYVYPAGMDHIPSYWVLLSIIFTLFLIQLTINSKKALPFAIICFALSIHISLLSSVIQGVPFYARMYGVADDGSLSKFRLGLKFIETMPKVKEEGRPIYFWYSNADRLANSLQSTYLWGYSRLSDSTNGTGGLPDLKGVNPDLLRAREEYSLVLFDREERKVSEGIEELRRIGLGFGIKKTRDICEQTICYSIAVLDVNSPSLKIKQDWQEGKGRPLSIALDWSEPGTGARIERNGKIVSIVTHPKAWNYAAVASMVFSEQPPAHGIIRILVSVTGANAGLGFIGSNISNFIKRREVRPKNEPQELFFEFENLAELRNFVVQTWDQDKSAKVKLLEFSVRHFARSEQ